MAWHGFGLVKLVGGGLLSLFSSWSSMTFCEGSSCGGGRRSYSMVRTGRRCCPKRSLASLDSFTCNMSSSTSSAWTISSCTSVWTAQSACCSLAHFPHSLFGGRRKPSSCSSVMEVPEGLSRGSPFVCRFRSRLRVPSSIRAFSLATSSVRN